jgi:hypothetical protein
MRPATIAALRAAVHDPATVERYWSHVRTGDEHRCWYWLGAVAGRGHGRFQIADHYDHGGPAPQRRTIVVIAHRFGYALHHGVDVLLTVPVVAHACDNPLCQNPQHWQASTPSANRREWARRRREVGGPLADVRGARGRARALRDAVRDGGDISDVEHAGAPPVHRDQLPLLPAPERRYQPEPPPPGSPAPAPQHDAADQLGLFDEA